MNAEILQPCTKTNKQIIKQQKTPLEPRTRVSNQHNLLYIKKLQKKKNLRNAFLTSHSLKQQKILEGKEWGKDMEQVVHSILTVMSTKTHKEAENTLDSEKQEGVIYKDDTKSRKNAWQVLGTTVNACNLV